MRLLCNIVWWVLFGWLIALVAYVVGLILTLLVVTSPVGLGLMEYGKFLFAPFSREMISKSRFELDKNENVAWKAYSKIVMILYVVLFGIWLVIALLFAAIANVFTIIGIPNAYIIVKSLGTAFNPVGKKCLSKYEADALKIEEANKNLDKKFKRQSVQ